MPVVFISYRREDSAGYAGRLHEELAERFGPGQVFRDVDTLRAGQDFDAAIRYRLEQCQACIVMIGPAWLKAQDASGRRRLGQPGDYVTLEIAAALGRPEVAVVPVLVGGATMPPPEEMPDALRPLARRHALSVRDETWEADMDRLAAVLSPSASTVTRVKSSSPRHVLRYAVVAVALLLAGAAWLFQSPDSNTPASADPASSATPAASADASDGPAYAIDVPAGMGEVAFGDLIYAVVAGSVQQRGSGLRVWLRIRASNEGFYGANFWDDSFRLVVNGQVIAPTSGLNEVLDRRSIQQGVVRFDVPTTVRTARLRITHQNRSGELPLDLSGNGTPPKHDDTDPRDALSHAVLTAVVRNEAPLVASGDTSTTVMRISRRAFVNTQRVTVVVKWTNNGRYDIGTGDLTLRLAVGGEVLAPAKMPSEVVAPGSTYIGDVVFEVPPQIKTATLRSELRGQTTEQVLTLH